MFTYGCGVALVIFDNPITNSKNATQEAKLEAFYKQLTWVQCYSEIV